MKQQDIEDAVRAYLQHGDPEPWKEVLEAIKRGEVLVEVRKNGMVLSANSTPNRDAFAAKLNELRQQAGLTLQQLADASELSMSAVIRNMRGQALTHWPVMVVLIKAMGAEPKELRALYDLARAEPLTATGKPRSQRLTNS